MSPKSIEACRRLGFRAYELKKKSNQDIIQMMRQKDNQANPDQETLQMFQAHLEERRGQKIIQVQNNNIQIFFSKNNKNKKKVFYLKKGFGFDQSIYTTSQMGSISLVEKEKNMFEKMKKRQEIEIEKMIEFEKITQAIRQQNEIKMQKAYEREQKRQLENKQLKIEVKKHQNIQKKKID
ncbi:hypothetical protein IMG5_186700 [Ichthyophthirius multifiliis]|uniref:Uncharacterized protein n=1 Tax=Ichthyophthirius multifiliis TaxID=5932 RepID=G0R3N5_ICHMU|nr:hypothetical protein IMG5_186700 [Ichthyophthirius multifiliis]EGR27918.1 hypothetical protein IMG5_186700 [Ichthyophthirius multifiliis]|eukprot:XP_004027263.1 hypothetical protein IMG5_186700 [Ichthyophthirius multifiliis]